MTEKPTTELLHILNELKPEEMDDYIQKYGKDRMNTSVFSEYIAEHNLSVSAIVQNCNGLISKSY
ncbi:MAG: hypothetical protein ACI4L2_05345, partial [Wujia sp.]